MLNGRTGSLGREAEVQQEEEAGNKGSEELHLGPQGLNLGLGGYKGQAPHRLTGIQVEGIQLHLESTGEVAESKTRSDPYGRRGCTRASTACWGSTPSTDAMA